MSNFIERLTSLRSKHNQEAVRELMNQKAREKAEAKLYKKEIELENRCLDEAAMPVLRNIKEFMNGKGAIIRLHSREDQIAFPNDYHDSGHIIQGPAAVYLIERHGNKKKGSAHFIKITVGGDYLKHNDLTENFSDVSKRISDRVVEEYEKNKHIGSYLYWDQTSSNVYKGY